MNVTLDDLIFDKSKIRFINVAVLYAIQHGRCIYCNKYMFFRAHRYPGDNGYTVDHFFPQSKGFHKVGNSVLACRKCNEVKGNTIPDVATIIRVTKLYKDNGLNFVFSGFDKRLSRKLKMNSVYRFDRKNVRNRKALVPVFERKEI